MSKDDKLPCLHNFILHEAQIIFFDHIRAVIFDEHELRSLQSLLRDYGSIISWYGSSTSGVKSFYITDQGPGKTNMRRLMKSKKKEKNIQSKVRKNGLIWTKWHNLMQYSNYLCRIFATIVIKIKVKWMTLYYQADNKMGLLGTTAGKICSKNILNWRFNYTWWPF